MSETPSRKQKALQNTVGVGKYVIVIGTAVTAAFGWLEAREAAKTAIQDTAAADAKVDKTYTVLAEAIKRMAEDSAEQRKIIGDLRETVGELKGALKATRHRAGRPTSAAPALSDLLGAGGGGEAEPEAADAPEEQTMVQLPETIQVEQRTVDQYIERKAKK